MTDTLPQSAVSHAQTIAAIKPTPKPSYADVYHGVDSVMNAELYGRIAAEVHRIIQGA